MISGAESDRSRRQPDDQHLRLRRALLVVAALLTVAWLVPPLSGAARRYEFMEALQFSFFAIVIPALVVTGAPWSLLRLASDQPRLLDDDGRPLLPGGDLAHGGLAGGDLGRVDGLGDGGLGRVDRLAEARRRHPEPLRAAGFTALYLAGVILWRTPVAVDGVRRHPWTVAVELVVLVAVGIGLWLELVESPPLTPRLTRPARVALAAIAMWAVWIMAYLVGLSHGSWYQAYPHHAGVGLSLSADQQLATGVLWFVSACAFIPVVYWNLVRWLQSEENPDEELHLLMRQERIRDRTYRPRPDDPLSVDPTAT